MSPMARFAVISVWLAVSAPALAYLDAGSASLLFQAAAASLFTGLFIIKTYWANLKAWFSGRRRNAPPPPQDEQP